ARLGAPATALGQVFAYTVEGPLDLGALRALQDEVLAPTLARVPGVAEVASCGGFVTELEVSLDPAQLAGTGHDASSIASAIARELEAPAGSAVIERHGLELVVRAVDPGLSLRRLENLPIPIARAVSTLSTPRASGGVPRAQPSGLGLLPNVRMNAGDTGHMGGMSSAPALDAEPARGSNTSAGDAASSGSDASMTFVPLASLGSLRFAPGSRVGALADARGEQVGGFVALRPEANPRAVIADVKQALRALNDPTAKLLPAGVFCAPFYDRSTLIDETIATLTSALQQELWIALAVVALFLLHAKASLLVASTLPLAVLLAFLAMHLLGLDSNLMSLTGIAIAIGTMVDLGIVMTESCHRALVETRGELAPRKAIERAARSVALPLLTATATTVLCFLPLLLLEAEEGQLFRPLVWTKTLALLAAAATGLFLVPVLCALCLVERERGTTRGERCRGVAHALLAAALGLGAAQLELFDLRPLPAFLLVAGASALLFARLSSERLVSIEANPLARAVARLYAAVLTRALERKALFLALPAALVLLASLAGLGAARCRAPLRAVLGPRVDELALSRWMDARFPGLGTEFLPPLDEGALLYMPSLLPGATLAETSEVLRAQNERFAAIPEIARVVGKAGRAESALDPAPVGMIETVLVLRARADWRAGLTRTALLEEVLAAARWPGVSGGRGALLQPIETRLVMLSSGVKTPLALRLRGRPRDAQGRELEPGAAVASLDAAAQRVRSALRGVPGVRDPVVETNGGLAYQELELEPARLAAEGLRWSAVADVLQQRFDGASLALQASSGPRTLRVRSEERSRSAPLDEMAELELTGGQGQRVRLASLGTLVEREGPAMIESQDGALRQHVGFSADGIDEGRAMARALEALAALRASELAAGRADPLPPGVEVEPAGRYEAQARATARLAWIVPLCVALIFALVALCFRSLALSLFVFSAVPVTCATGVLFVCAWPALQALLFSAGLSAELAAAPLHLSVAVAVGFVALFGLATDDGVLIGALLEQRFAGRRAASVTEVRAWVVDAGLRRVRPCLMTSVTTIAALLPLLWSSGRGSELALPMAVPLVGGMLGELLSMFVVPVLYAWREERALRRAS
ncbi:MAG: efflux RND transporter permease subunit, partial [Planctomycetes bacterium]|nr:efflux RND transporter permease subunit [Planctomycetota bacterium]